MVFSGCFVHAQEIVLCNSRMNIVYATVENLMSVAVDGIPCRLLVVQSNDGIIANQNGCRFTFLPATEDVASIKVFRKKGTEHITIGEASWRG